MAVKEVEVTSLGFEFEINEETGLVSITHVQTGDYVGGYNIARLKDDAYDVTKTVDLAGWLFLNGYIFRNIDLKMEE